MTIMRAGRCAAEVFEFAMHRRKIHSGCCERRTRGRELIPPFLSRVMDKSGPSLTSIPPLPPVKARPSPYPHPHPPPLLHPSTNPSHLPTDSHHLSSPLYVSNAKPTLQILASIMPAMNGFICSHRRPYSSDLRIRSCIWERDHRRWWRIGCMVFVSVWRGGEICML